VNRLNENEIFRIAFSPPKQLIDLPFRHVAQQPYIEAYDEAGTVVLKDPLADTKR